jgi:hypothetical protein
VTFELAKRFFSRRDAPGRRDFLRSLAIGAAAHRLILNGLVQPYHVIIRVNEVTACSLTRLVIHPLSPAELEFMALNESIIAQAYRAMNIPPHFLLPTCAGSNPASG